MKKILAAALALVMTASVLVSCGESDKSSSKADSTTTSAAAESKSDESAANGDESKAEPKDISEMPKELKNQETASFKFTTDMNVDDFVSALNANEYKDDESQVKLSIEELAGVPMLRVQTLDQNKKKEWKVPKIHFAMNKLFKGHESDLPKIFSIKLDVVTKAVGKIKNDDGEECLVPAFFGGKVVTQPYDAAQKTQTWNELTEFSWSEWTSEWAYYELEVTPGPKDAACFQDTTEDQYLAIMKWSIENQADLYIANITFLDENGDVIDCPYGK